MKLKNGTHISGGKNCCAKTVYTGDVIHVICQYQSRHFMLSRTRTDYHTHAQDLPEPCPERLRDLIDGLSPVDDGHARQVRYYHHHP